jgi:gliding motility-associated-like protein
MKLIKTRILLALLIVLGCTITYAQSKEGAKSKGSQASTPAFQQAFEKQIMQLGEPYISWWNQETDKIPDNFSEQIANLKWPVGDDPETDLQGSTKEAYYHSEFLSIRKLKLQGNSSLWTAIAGNPLNTMCGNGNFANSVVNLSEWSGGYGVFGGNSKVDPVLATYQNGFNPTGVGYNLFIGDCSTPNDVLHPCSYQTSWMPSQDNQDHHSIVSYGNDPILGSISSFKTTTSSSNLYSFRLGNACVGNGTEYLSKKFVVSGKGIIRFNYALVMTGPQHTYNRNPSFWVKIFDSVGNPIHPNPGLVYLNPVNPNSQDSVISDTTDIFLQKVAIYDAVGKRHVYNLRDWTCATIDLRKYINHTLSVVLVTTDCTQGGDWGYAYIDDWCGDCGGSTTGIVKLNPIPDSCITNNTQITVDYTLPTKDTITGTATINLIFYQNGNPIGYTLTSPTLNANGTYTFTIDPEKLPCNGTGYDVFARANFTIDTVSYKLYSPDPDTIYGIRSGKNNDLVCCSSPCDSTDVSLMKDSVGCCYSVFISNKYSPSYFTGISITSSGLSIGAVSCNNTWSTITYKTPDQVVFNKVPGSIGIPLNPAGVQFQLLGTICFAGTGPSTITVSFIGPPPNYDTICPKKQTIECSTPKDTNCVVIIDQKAECVAGVVKMKLKLKNNSMFSPAGPFTMRGLIIDTQTPDVIPDPKFIAIPDLLPGQTSAYIEVTLLISNNATSACFFIAPCDQNTQPGEGGPFPEHCCMDSILYCVQIPPCNPCDGISITASSIKPDTCCYNLTLTSNYVTENIGYLDFTGLGGTQFALFSGWSILGSVGSGHVRIGALGGGVGPGTYTNFAWFCLTGTSASPHAILVKIMDVKGVVICTDTLKFECKLVTPTCANIINDSLYCSGNLLKYTFYVKNNAPFPLCQVDFRTADTSVVLDTNYIWPNPCIGIDSIGGPYTVTLVSFDKKLDRFCMYLTGHNAIYDSVHGIAPTECCTDSLGVICLPMIKCGCDTTVCCRFENLIIPNGITPNEDGINDVFVIQNPKCCESISIKVYNRWGNLVYKNGDYKNDWKGVNQNGDKLVQGTYFVVIELPTGNKKETYIDIRY